MTTSPTPDRLARLRRLMKERGLDAYVVPTGDPHQSEYVPACWRRREWLTGFSGSAGIAHVGLERAFLVADSRYWLQAERELAGSGIELVRLGTPGVPSYAEWLEGNAAAGRVVGVDPQVVSVEDERKWRSALATRSARLELVDGNLVDAIWEHRPVRSQGAVTPHDVRFSGESPASKLARVGQALEKAGAEATVVTALDAACWLLDLRGTDVDYNPVVICAAIVTRSGATLFIDEEKVTPAVRAHLPKTVATVPYEELGDALEDLAERGAEVLVDPAASSAWVVQRLTSGAKKAVLHEAQSPITLFKARKNATEVEGARRCHVRDGVALVRFLAWLEHEVAEGRPVTEIEAADRLALFRAEGEHHQGLSFETISAFGDHGAIVHYRPAEEGDRVIDASSLYLVDSGAQYSDGTTDVTRTVCFGTPTAEQRDRFTRVLRGHVDLARTIFPAGTTGKNLDVLARAALWEQGLDYGHGTGHGVGSYLNVHEGPQRIAQKGPDVALEPGMIVSNEPGYYAPGSYGIRIESLVVTVQRKAGGDGAAPFLGFDTLTACPIDRGLVDATQLSPAQRAWIDEYHAWCRQVLLPALDERTGAWLAKATAPL